MKEADKNSSLPAYPVNYEPYYPGLTKREYFAGLAIQALISKRHVINELTARDAVRAADLLLEELKNKKIKKIDVD